MSEIMMKGDCRVGKPLPEDVEVVRYDTDGIPKEYLVRDENDKIVMVLNPETFSRFRNHPKVAAAIEKWRREPKNVFKVAKNIAVAGPTAINAQLLAGAVRPRARKHYADGSYDAFARDHLRAISRSIGLTAEQVKANADEDAARWAEIASLFQPNGGDA